MEKTCSTYGRITPKIPYTYGISRALRVIVPIAFTFLGVCFLCRDYLKSSPIFNERLYQLDLVSSNILKGIDTDHQFPINMSSVFFSEKNSMLQTNEIPLLLMPDVEGNHKFSNVLSECFGIKNVPLKTFFEDERYQVCVLIVNI